MAVTNNASQSSLGQINKTGSQYAMYLKVFSGEVLTSFLEATQTMGVHTVKQITGGKVAQFPVMGTTSAKYHTPGQSLIEGDNAYLQQIAHGERTIAIDKMMVSPVFIANIDEKINHYDVRNEYSRLMAHSLAKQFDIDVLRTLIIAANTAADVAFTGALGGATITDAALGSVARGGTGVVGSNWVTALFAAAQKLDEKNIPSEDRYCFLPPDAYYSLITDKQVINVDYQNSGNGSLADGRVYKVAGITLLKTNLLPVDNFAGTTNQASGASGTDINSYVVNATKCAGVVFHRSAVGTVKLLDIQMESEYQVERQGTLLVAKMAVGHGVLRPESAIYLKTA